MTPSSVNNTPLRPFEPMVLDFLGEVSAAILTSPIGRQFPDLSAFAFYIRKANILKLCDMLFPSVQSGTPNQELESRLGRGLCFHIAPANIPVNFAFTWVFSLLAGNANIVRLPSKDFPQVDALLTIIKNHLARYPELETRNIFVKYPRTDNETTAAYSRMADCRMIWGGDRTIAAIKALLTKPRCVDIAFADRYSVAMINAEAVLAADDTRFARLIQDFYNDTYLMDQNACSSPQVILWEGADVEKTKERFWKAVYEYAEKKYELQDAVAVDKYTIFCEESVGNPAIKSITRSGNILYRAELSSLVSAPENSQLHNSSTLTSHRGKAGFFFEYNLTDREELFKIITEKFQTITQFGIDVDELRRQIIERNLRGIDRIVSVGHAMDIGLMWDGHDLIRELSRIVA